MTIAPKPFSWPVRVYYEDTDAGGVVYYANYLKFFERARSEWLRALKAGQQNLLEEHRLMFVVTGVDIEYRAPARLDDALTVNVQIDKIGRASMQFAQEVRRGTSLLVSGKVRVACVHCDSLRPAPIPEYLAQLFRGGG